MLPGKNSTSVIDGYNESKLAKGENNDCVVKSLAVVYGITYDEAHKIAKERFKREDKDGTRTILGFQLEENKGMIINNKSFSIIPYEQISYVGSSRYTHEKNKKKDHKIRIVVRQLVELFPKGTYMVLVRKHAFSLVDGVIVGNPEDSLMLKKKVMNLIKFEEIPITEVD